MNSKQLACDPERIELFLNQQLNGAEQFEFEAHLDDCRDCRRELETKAATEDVWTAIRDSLHSESSDAEFTAAATASGDSDGQSFSVDTVLQLLAPTDDDRMLGRLGAYEVVGVIGAGGMGVVLKAFDSALNRYVAIKILSPLLGNSGAARKRFSREAQAAAAVVHDNVIEIHGVDDANGLPYLVMPYVRGPSLQKRLDDEGPLSLVEVLRIAKQAATGLAEAHAQGLVHRDVKPANILLADGVERVKLTDFGLARAADDASLTKTGVIAGTPQFMSPEQARGDAVNPTSDLFSLGSVMYTMCTGRPPFRAETSYGILRRITDTEPRPIREVNPDIPDWLCGVITKLMAKQPEDRFDSAGEVAELLEECLAHVQHPATAPLPKRVEQLPRSYSVARYGNSKPPSSPSFYKPVRLIVTVLFAFAIIFAGFLIVLELNKGKLTIKSEADNVLVKIMQGDRVVKRLTVMKDGASVRIAAGQYIVEIAGGIDGLTVDDETVTLRRGGREVVTIIREVAAAPKNVKQRSPAPAVSGVERLQGVWTMDICDSETRGFGDTQRVVRNWRWVIRGNHVLWSRSPGEVWQVKLSVDPTKSPKEIDLTYLDGPHKGKKSLGMYQWGGVDGKMLQLSVQDPGANVARPKSISMRGGGQTSLIFLEPLDERIQGAWAMSLCDSATEGFGDKPKVVQHWRWIIRDNEVLWSRSRGKVWRMKMSVDRTKSPKEIDLTYLNGPFKGKKSLGMYRWGGVDGRTLQLSIQDPGVDVPRPKTIGMRSYESSLIFLHRLDVDDELASLQGTWKFEIIQTDNWPKPIGKGPDRLGRGDQRQWIIKGNEIAWTSPDGERIRLSFTIDPTKIPSEIDATFVSGPHKGQKCLGIYQRGGLDGVVLWFCLTDPGSQAPRPKDVSHVTNEGRTMIGLTRIGPPQ